MKKKPDPIGFILAATFVALLIWAFLAICVQIVESMQRLADLL